MEQNIPANLLTAVDARAVHEQMQVRVCGGRHLEALA
jgi:hypothetical protein